MFDFSARILGLADSVTLGLAEEVRRRRAEGKEITDLSGGEPDFDTPPRIKEAAAAALGAGQTKYVSSRGLYELRNLIAAQVQEEVGVGVDPSRGIIVTPGAKQAIAYAVLALVQNGDEALIADPCWVSFEPMIKIAGGSAVRVPTYEADGFKLKAESLRSRIGPRSKLLILNNPNNPTGALLSAEDMRPIAETVREAGLFVVADEIYGRIIFNDARFTSFAALPGMSERTLVVNGFSKSFAMTGWRLGYAWGPADMIDAVDKLQQHIATCANSFAQHGAIEAISGEDYTGEMVEAYQRRRDKLAAVVEAVGLPFTLPQGAFYFWLNVKPLGGNSVSINRQLIDEALLAATPGSAFGPGGEGYLRLSLAVSDNDIETAAVKIKEFVYSHARNR